MQGKNNKQIKNASLLAGALPAACNGKQPYEGRQKTFFQQDTQMFVFENAKYANNYYKAKVQGCIPGDFDTIRGAYIRTMDIVEQSTGSNAPNDWQAVYFQDPTIQGLYTGAKLWYGGNTWIATAPKNMASASGNAVIRRCNAFWNYLDYYGNIKSEPFVWAKGPAQATANEYLDYMVIPNSYQKCVMQLNDATRDIAYNRRMVLGSSAYEVRGIVDFVQDFTDVTDEMGNPTDRKQAAGQCHILYFDLVYQQPLEIDDMENSVAGGKAFEWTVLVSGNNEMPVNGTQILSVRSLRNGEAPDTANNPVSYRFESSNENVLTVDENGTVHAVSEGTAMVTVYLSQNESKYATFDIAVSETSSGVQIVAEPPIPDSISMLQTYAGKIRVYENGAETEEQVKLQTSGAADWAYSASLDDENNLTITCFSQSEKPLEMKISALNATIEKSVQLKGF